MAIYELASSDERVINVSTLKSVRRTLDPDLIAPADEDCSDNAIQDHAAEPIKSMDDIVRISRYLIDSGRYRDNMLFILGINFGLRVSDLRELRFSNLIDDNLTFRDRFAVFEKKTRNTRKRKKNRYITINNAVIDAVTLYLENTEGVRLSDYMFRSESYNGSNVNRPLDPKSINRIMYGLRDDLGLNIRMSTHTLRKTFCYHQMLMSNNDPRKLALLQKMLGHSTMAQTLDYIGITSEEIDDAYRKLNLGSATDSYLVDSAIFETDGGYPSAPVSRVV